MLDLPKIPQKTWHPIGLLEAGNCINDLHVSKEGRSLTFAQPHADVQPHPTNVLS